MNRLRLAAFFWALGAVLFTAAGVLYGLDWQKAAPLRIAETIGCAALAIGFSIRASSTLKKSKA